MRTMRKAYRRRRPAKRLPRQGQARTVRAVSVEERAGEPAATVRKAVTGDARTMSRSLARAFQDDPIMSWIFPADDRRPAILRAFFGMLSSRVYIAKGETYVHGDGTAAALWAPPGAWKMSTLDIIRNALPLARVMGRRLFVGLR